MWSPWSSPRFLPLVLLLCGSVLVESGCDGGTSKRASFYQRLVGTWTAERLDVGPTNHTNQLNERYTALRFDFQSGDDGRTYRITGDRVEDTTLVLAQGAVEMLDAQLLQMRPGQGFEAPVTWTFDFEGSRAIFEVPESRTAGSEDFLNVVLPGGSWGDAQRVRLELAREE